MADFCTAARLIYTVSRTFRISSPWPTSQCASKPKPSATSDGLIASLCTLCDCSMYWYVVDEMRSAFRMYCPPCDLVMLCRIFLRQSWISLLLLIGFNLQIWGWKVSGSSGVLQFSYQVDEISDIGALLRERYHERGAGISGCLKLSMTDGVQRVVGIECQPIPALRNLFPAGMKVCGRSIWSARICLSGFR
jgi:hypothetical protein